MQQHRGPHPPNHLLLTATRYARTVWNHVPYGTDVPFAHHCQRTLVEFGIFRYSPSRPSAHSLCMFTVPSDALSAFLWASWVASRAPEFR